MAYKGKHGELYLSGRGDFQVKILGNRVEPEGIERTLVTHSGIVQAVVMVTKVSGDNSLVAFVVNSDAEIIPTPEELRSHCGKVIPHYMIPTQIYFLSSLPMTINGKVDRQLLLDLVDNS